jgi:hypothetical protein
LFGNSHLQDHQSRPRLEDTRGFRQPTVQIYQVADSPPDHCAIESSVSERQLERVSIYGVDAVGLVTTLLQHGPSEVGTDNSAVKTRRPTKGCGQIQGAGANV